MKVTYQTTPLGKAVMLESGDIRLGITYQKGLRINYISPFGRENISYFDGAGAVFSLLPDGKKWYALGGHRLWKSPEDWHCYYNDNLEAFVEVKDNIFYAKTQQTSDGLILKMKIEFAASNEVKITHAIENASQSRKKIALWAITALACGGKVTIPFDKAVDPLLPNRNVALWSYTDINDKRLAISKESITVTPNPQAKPLKVGCFNGESKIVWEDGFVVFEKTADKITGNYPDFYCNAECYTDANVAEIETLSPLYEIEPLQQKEHTEYWTFRKKI